MVTGNDGRTVVVVSRGKKGTGDDGDIDSGVVVVVNAEVATWWWWSNKNNVSVIR